MVRRTLTLAALVLLFAVSGAMAGETSDRPTFTLTPTTYDTTSSTLTAADSATGGHIYNDTVIYYSNSVTVGRDFSAIVGQIVMTVGDTSTATMLIADTAKFELQSKLAMDSATDWRTVWVSQLIPLDEIGDSVTARTISITSDSLPSCFDYWRVKMTYIVEEDSITSHCTLLGTSTLAPTERFRIPLIFRD